MNESFCEKNLEVIEIIGIFGGNKYDRGIFKNNRI